MCIQIRLNKDIQAYHEGAPNRGPLRIPMIDARWAPDDLALLERPLLDLHLLVEKGQLVVAPGYILLCIITT